MQLIYAVPEGLLSALVAGALTAVVILGALVLREAATAPGARRR